MKRILWIIAFSLMVACNSNNGSSFGVGNNTDTARTIATTESNWTVVYNGYGNVTFDVSTGIVMEPKTATAPDETHAALLLSTLTQNCPVKDFTLTIKAVTESQLRMGSAPNPWEVFWIFFNYQPVSDAKTTNYLILKTNGVELGRAFNATDQAFLYTATEPHAVIGQSNTFVLQKSGNTLSVTIDGSKAFDYQGGNLPNALYDQAGNIGLYTEDARVRVTSVTLDSAELANCKN